MQRLIPVLFLIATALFADTSSKRRMPRVRLGGISVGAGYSHWGGGRPVYWGGPWGPAYGWGPWYGYGLGSMFYPGYFSGFAYAPDKGEVKLTAADKNAEVYIDGGFAGTAGRLKSMWLDPGVYNLEVRPGTGDPYQKKIYVLSGKALRLEAR